MRRLIAGRIPPGPCSTPPTSCSNPQLDLTLGLIHFLSGSRSGSVDTLIDPSKNEVSPGLSKEHGYAVRRDLGRRVTVVLGSGMNPLKVTPAGGHMIFCLRKGRVLCATRMSRGMSGLQIYLAARDEQQQMVYHKTQNMIVPLKLIHNSRNFVLQSSVTSKVNKSLTGNCSLLCKQIG